MGRVFGYARPTAAFPDPDTHAQALASAGSETIFVEKNNAQARRAMRERRRLLDQIRSGDTLILLNLDQLGTSFDDMLRCLELLIDGGVDIQVLNPRFETAGPFSNAYRDLLKLLAGARSALHSETVKLNIATAQTKGGKKAGKPARLTPEQWPEIKARIEETTLDTVAGELDVHRQTLWNYRRKMRELEEADEV